MRLLLLALVAVGACANDALRAEPFPDLGARAVASVPCGGAICDTSDGKACCEIARTCTADPCASGEQRDACDGPEDCPGALCCLVLSPAFGTACATACTGGGYHICHVDADCATGETCLQLETAGDLRGCAPRTGG